MSPGALADKNIDAAAFQAFVEDFKKESDRAAVIVGAAKLDLLLYQLLQKALLPCTGSSDELLEGDSGLGTFHARIHISHRLGLIDDQLARALHLVRKIRNSFAHEPASTSLDSSSHKDRVRELVAPLLPFKEFQGAQNSFVGQVSGASRDFRAVLALMVIRIDQLVVSSEQVAPSVVQTLIGPHWTRV